MASRMPRASSSRVSLDTQVPARPGEREATSKAGQRAPTNAAAVDEDPYDMSSVLAGQTGGAVTGSLLPSFGGAQSSSSGPSNLLASFNFGATFTSAGTLPKSSTAKPVAQRRAQAPPLTVSDLRKVSRSELDGYVNAVGPLIQRWKSETKRLNDDDSDDGPSKHERGLAIDGLDQSARAHTDDPDELDEQLPPLDAVPPIYFDPAFNLSNPRTFDLVTEKIRESPFIDGSASPPFGPDSRPGTPPGQAVVRGLGPLTLADLAKDQVLQEKLSHYTAVVESHLVREIGQRSSAFFAALTNLQSLHAQGQDCLDAIAKLERHLAPGQPGIGSAALKSLTIIRAQARRRALERIRDGLRRIDEVHRALQGTKELVEAGQWIDAIEVAEQVEDMYYAVADDAAGQRHPSTSPRSTTTKGVNPSRLKALAAVPVQLSLLRSQVARSLSVELVNVLDHEMEVSVEEYIRTTSAGSTDSWKAPASDEPRGGATHVRERAFDRTRDVVGALVRSSGMEEAVAAWRESVLKDVRSMVREHLPSASGTPTAGTPLTEAEDALALAGSRASVDLGSVSEKSLSLAKKLRATPHSAFLSLARNTFIGLLGCLEVIDIHAQVLAELYAGFQTDEQARRNTRSRRRNESTSMTGDEQPDDAVKTVNNLLSVPGTVSLDSTSTPTPTQDATRQVVNGDDTLRGEILDVVQASADLANQRFSKVVSVRTEVHANLCLADFVDFFDETWDFVVACETVCKRMIVGLRGVVIGQAKTFLQQYHQKRINEVARSVENEQWQAVDVPPASQRTIEVIVESATADPATLLFGRRRSRYDQASGNGHVADEAGTMTTTTAAAKQLEIEGRPFFAVSAGLACLDNVLEYLRVLFNCPLLVTDVMSKVIEFLKTYNSRTCQVVLGAGAMRSAGLKNITAKHLALASQALAIIIALVPYIREAMRRHLSPKQAVMLVEFDKLKRDYQEHQNEIHAKLVAIMADRLQVHSRTLQSIDWEQTGQPTPNAYMESLVKEHTTLYKVLNRFLHAQTVDSIMSQVFDALEGRLESEFDKIEFKSDAAKERALQDSAFLKERLGDLKGGLERETPGTTLHDKINAKLVKLPPAPISAPQSRASSSIARHSRQPSSDTTPNVTAAKERVSESPSVRSSLEQPRPSAESAPAGADLPTSTCATSSTAAQTAMSPPLSRESSDTGRPATPSTAVGASTAPPSTSTTAPSTSTAAAAATPAIATPVRKLTMKERLAELARRKTSHDQYASNHPTPLSASQTLPPQPHPQAAEAAAVPTRNGRVPDSTEEEKGPPTPAKDTDKASAVTARPQTDSPRTSLEQPATAVSTEEQPAETNESIEAKGDVATPAEQASTTEATAEATKPVQTRETVEANETSSAPSSAPPSEAATMQREGLDESEGEATGEAAMIDPDAGAASAGADKSMNALIDTQPEETDAKEPTSTKVAETQEQQQPEEAVVDQPAVEPAVEAAVEPIGSQAAETIDPAPSQVIADAENAQVAGDSSAKVAEAVEPVDDEPPTSQDTADETGLATADPARDIHATDAVEATDTPSSTGAVTDAPTKAKGESTAVEAGGEEVDDLTAEVEKTLAENGVDSNVEVDEDIEEEQADFL